MSSKSHNTIDTPGKYEEIKIKILDMVQRGENPFDILMEFAQWLERETGEVGYAKEILENLHVVHGLALHDIRPLESELQAVITRKERIESTLRSGVLTNEEETRARFALSQHQKRVQYLQATLRKVQENS